MGEDIVRSSVKTLVYTYLYTTVEKTESELGKLAVSFNIKCMYNIKIPTKS